MTLEGNPDVAATQAVHKDSRKQPWGKGSLGRTLPEGLHPEANRQAGPLGTCVPNGRGKGGSGEEVWGTRQMSEGEQGHIFWKELLSQK